MSSAPDHIYLDLAVVNNDTDGSRNKNTLQFSENRTNAILYNPSNYEMSVVRFEVDTPASTLPLFIPLLNVDGVNNDPNETAYTISMAQINSGGTALTNLKTANVRWSPEDVSSGGPSNNISPNPVRVVGPSITYTTNQNVDTITLAPGGETFIPKDVNGGMSANASQKNINNCNYNISTVGGATFLSIYDLVSLPDYLLAPGFTYQLKINNTGSQPAGIPNNTFFTIYSATAFLDPINGNTFKVSLLNVTGVFPGNYNTDSLILSTTVTTAPPEYNAIITSLASPLIANIGLPFPIIQFPLQITYSFAAYYFCPTTNLVINTPQDPATVPLLMDADFTTSIGKTIAVNGTYYTQYNGINYFIAADESDPVNKRKIVIQGILGDFSLFNFDTVSSGDPTSGIPSTAVTSINGGEVSYNSATNTSTLTIIFPQAGFAIGLYNNKSMSFLVTGPVFQPYTTIASVVYDSPHLYRTYLNKSYTWLAPTGQSGNPGALFDAVTAGPVTNFPAIKTGSILSASTDPNNNQFTFNSLSIQSPPSITSQNIGTGYYNCYNAKWWLSCINATLDAVWRQFAGNTNSDHSPHMTIDKDTNNITLLTPILQNPGTESYSFNFAVSQQSQMNARTTPIYLSTGSTDPTVQYVLFFNEPLFNLFSSLPFIYYGDTLATKGNTFDNPTDNATLAARPYLLEYFIQPISFSGANRFTFTNSAGVENSWITTVTEYSPVPMWNPIMSIQFTSNLLPNLPSYVTAQLPYNDIQSNGLVSSGNNSQITDMITDIQVGLVSGSEYKPSVLYVPKGQYRLIDLQGNQPILNVDFKVSWKTKYGQVVAFRLGAQCGANLKILFRRKRFDLLNLPPYDTN
jgi:hypothetical protein